MAEILELKNQSYNLFEGIKKIASFSSPIKFFLELKFITNNSNKIDFEILIKGIQSYVKSIKLKFNN